MRRRVSARVRPRQHAPGTVGKGQASFPCFLNPLCSQEREIEGTT